MAVFQSISQYKEGCLIQGRDPIGVVGVPKVKARTIPHKFFLASDLCLVWISTGIAHLALMVFARDVHNPWGHELFHAAPLGPMFLFSVLVVLFADARGLYEFPWKTSYKGDLKLLGDAVTCSGIVIGVGSYLSGSRARSAGAYVLAVALAWTLMASWRKLVRSQTIPGLTEKRNVVIVGYGRFAHLLRQQLDQNPQLGYVVKGFVCRRRTPRSNPKGNGAGDPQLLGTVDELSEITRAHFIDEIFISVPSDRHLVRDIARKARAARVLARVIPDLHDGLADDVPVEYIGQFPSLTLYPQNGPTLSLILKRLMDFILSGAALVLLSPLFAVVGFIVKLDSKGPVFYRAQRVGKKGVTFACYKFRTMVENADGLKESLAHLNERDGILFKIAADPRITRVGRYLRKFSIDELPQLWNVFKGEMSLVGPRPPACSEYTQYSLEHLRRLDVTPGLTGLWQVTARQDRSFQSYIELDKEYVNNWSLGLDLRIMVRTVGVVLAGSGQ
ncbi:MAG: sugar transferase [Terriglobia bacterium]